MIPITDSIRVRIPMPKLSAGIGTRELATNPEFGLFKSELHYRSIRYLLTQENGLILPCKLNKELAIWIVNWFDDFMGRASEPFNEHFGNPEIQYYDDVGQVWKTRRKDIKVIINEMKKV